MVVDHVDNALHSAGMDLIHKMPEVFHGAVLRVDRAVIPVGIRAAQTSLLPRHTDGMDGHKPDDVRTQGLDTVQIGDQGVKGPLRCVVAYIDGIDHIPAQADICLFCHKIHSKPW